MSEKPSVDAELIIRQCCYPWEQDIAARFIAALEARAASYHEGMVNRTTIIGQMEQEVAALEAKLEAMEQALVCLYFDGRKDWPNKLEYEMALREALVTAQEEQRE